MRRLKPTLYTLPNGIEIASETPPCVSMPYWMVLVRPHRLIPVPDGHAGVHMLRARAVMTAHLGRQLRPGEQVRRRDGDKSNDNIENLFVIITRPIGRPRSRPLPGHCRLIDDLGGNQKIIDILHRRKGRGVSSPAISRWKQRGVIPFQYRAVLALEAAERCVPVPPNFLGEHADPQISAED